MFYPHPALEYGGIALYLGEFFLLSRQVRASHTTGP
jgi:hypothetical protein